MEIEEIKPEEITCFIEKMEEITTTIKVALNTPSFTLGGESYLTNKDMYNLLHISKRALQEYRDTGKIPYIKFGGRILYRKSDILRILEENYYKS